MHVSDKHKFVFVHNPKTAGMSIRKAIWHEEPDNKTFTGITTINGNEVSLMHLTLAQVHQYFPETTDKMQTYYTFMLIRNPFTRFISSFNYYYTSHYDAYCETGDIEKYRKVFEAFLDSLTVQNLSEFKYFPFVRQVDMAYHNGITYIDDFYKFEDLPNCLALIEHNNYALFRILRRMKHVNLRPMRERPQQIYTDKTRKKIVELYAADFDAFLYSKEL